jgi:hypothetical protein
MTPDKCNTTLVSDNPTYTTLNITQKPSWVHNPYPEGDIFSLVVAFELEDLDSFLAFGPLAIKVLNIFGHCATLRKCKQHPTNLNPTPILAIVTLTTTPSEDPFETLLSNVTPTIMPTEPQDMPGPQLT